MMSNTTTAYMDLLYQLQLNAWAALSEPDRDSLLVYVEMVLPQLPNTQKRQIKAFLEVIQLEFPSPRFAQIDRHFANA